MIPYSLCIQELLAGALLAFLSAILLPGYAWLAVARSMSRRLESRYPVLRSSLVRVFTASGLDAFTLAVVVGSVQAAAIAAMLARHAFDLSRWGLPIFAIYAGLSVLAILASRREEARHAVAARVTGESQPLPPLCNSESARQGMSRLELAAATVFLVIFVGLLLLSFSASPIAWDVPTMNEFQKALWGKHPEFEFRGGWAHAGLTLVSGIFQRDMYPLLNGSAMVGWLSVCLLLLGIRHLAGEVRPWLFTAVFCLFLSSSRFFDFLLNCKFSVLGICLYVLFIGLVNRHLRTNRLSLAIWAGFVVGLGWSTGKVAVFFGLFTLAVLTCLIRKRIAAVLLSAAFFSLVFLVGDYSSIVALLVVPLLPVLAACALRFIRAFRFAEPKTGPTRVKLICALLGSAILMVAAGFWQGYDGYSWYQRGRIVSLYTDGYGLYSCLIVLLGVAAWFGRDHDGYALPISATAAGALVPFAVIEIARYAFLPFFVPVVLLYEIGRDTSLYFVPLTLCWTAAVLILRTQHWLKSKHGFGYGNVWLGLLFAVVLFAPSARQHDVGGWERVSFTPLSQRAREIVARAKQARQTAESLGPTPAFNPLFIAFGRSELLVSRALGELGGPRSGCFVALVPEKARWNDPEAQGFFEWGVFVHMFPFVAVTTDPGAVSAKPMCQGNPILLVHNSAHLPAPVGLEAFHRVQRIGNYTIYSD